MVFKSANTTHISVSEIPVWSLSIGHHLPHDHAITPHITGGGEFPVCDGLWSCPPDWDFSTLPGRQKSSSKDTEEIWRKNVRQTTSRAKRFTAIVSAEPVSCPNPDQSKLTNEMLK